MREHANGNAGTGTAADELRAWCSLKVTSVEDGREVAVSLDDADGRLTATRCRIELVNALYDLVRDARGTMDLCGYRSFLQAMAQNESLWSFEDVEGSSATFVDVIDNRAEDAETARLMAVSMFGERWPKVTALQDGQALACLATAAEGGAS